MTWAFGKAILLGEHAVVYGHPALAGAVDATVRCAWRSAEAAPGRAPMLRVHAPAWRLAVEIARGATLDHAPPGDPARAMAALVHALDAHLGTDVLGTLGPGTITVDTRLPAAAGLGSSAALAVAVTRTLAQALGRRLDDDEVTTLAHSAERCFHANPSGVDVALATYGGLKLFRRGPDGRRALEPVHAPPMRLAVGLTGVPRSTATMVGRVAAARDAARAAGSTRVDDALAELGRASASGAEAMRAGDAARLGRLMNGAQELLAELGVSSPEIDRLCEIARAAGALGAKLTGAGGGGAVIAIAGAMGGAGAGEDAIVAAWRAAGHDGFVCRVGVTP